MPTAIVSGNVWSDGVDEASDDVDEVKRVISGGEAGGRLLELAVRHGSERPAHGDEAQWRRVRDLSADVVEQCCHVPMPSGAPLPLLIVDALRHRLPPRAAEHSYADATSPLYADAAGQPRLRRYARRALCSALARIALLDDAQCAPLASARLLRLLYDAEQYAPLTIIISLSHTHTHVYHFLVMFR
jgi:hypothetical protein